jgi:hypothetical protein
VREGQAHRVPVEIGVRDEIELRSSKAGRLEQVIVSGKDPSTTAPPCRSVLDAVKVNAKRI